MMSEDSENKKNGLTVGGVSGNKKMRLGRVHKKSDKAEDTAAPAAAPAASPAAAPAAAPAPAPATEKQEKAPEAEKPAKKEAAKKTEDSAPAKKTAKTSEKAKAAKTEEAEEKKPAAKRTKKTAEDQPAKEEAAEAKPAKKASSKTAKSEEVSEETKEAKKPVKAKKPAPAEEAKPEEPAAAEAPKAEEPKPEETKPEAPKAGEPAKTETPAPAAEEANIVRPAPRPRLSSAVVSLGDAPARGETIRSSTIITYTGRDRKSPARSGGFGGGQNGQGGQGGYGGGRGPQRGGGYQGHGGNGGFDKDKDEEPGQKNQFRRPARPKAESPIDEVKKSRTNYAEKSAFEKKHNESERRDGGKNNFADKRHQNRNSQFNGRVSEDGDYDEYSYKKKKKKQFEESIAEQQTITEIKIPAFITVKEFAEGIGKKSSEIIMALMKLGVMATINQELDFDTACLVAGRRCHGSR